MSVGFKKKICVIEARKIIVPLSSSRILGSRSKKGAPSRDFVRFTVYESKKPRRERTSDDRKFFINDHREMTLRAAQLPNRLSAGTRLLPGRGRVASKTMSFPQAVQLPARVVVVELAIEESITTFVNLYEPESKNAHGLLVVLPELLTKEQLFLDKITKNQPVWCWGGSKDTSFGPSGDTLPVIALTDEERKIIFHCRKSGDIVTLGSEVKVSSTLSL